MEELQEQQCASIGMKMSLLCVSLGAIAPAGIMFHEFLQSLPGGFMAYSRLHPEHTQVKWSILIGIIFTLVVLSLAAAFLGREAGKNICRRRRGFGGAILVGMGLALTCLLVGVVAAALFSLVTSPLDPFGSAPSIIALFGGVTLLVGAVPAMLLGVLYGVLVRWRLNKAER